MDGLDRIVGVAVAKDFNIGGKLLIATANGQIKQTDIDNLSEKTSKRGAKYINLKEDDQVVSIEPLYSNDYFIISITSDGNALRYTADNVPIIGLAASGVKNVNLSDYNKVVSVVAQPIDEVDNGQSQLLLFTNNGKGKRVKTVSVKGLSRGSKGTALVKQVKTNPFKIINMFDTDKIDKINLLSTSNEYRTITAKSEITLSEGGTGLSNVIKGGLSYVFDDLNLDLDPTKKKVAAKKAATKEKQLDIDDILDAF
jgi:topoisomerase-4 subunit A